MWHENAEEMMEYLKSVFRVDIDYRFALNHKMINNAYNNYKIGILIF